MSTKKDHPEQSLRVAERVEKMPPPVPSRSSFGNPQWKMGTSPPAFGSRYSPAANDGDGLASTGRI